MEGIFKKIRIVVWKHRWIAVASFLLTLLIFAPLFAFPGVVKKEYHGINIIPFGTDAHGYLTRAKEVLDGNGLGDIFLKEGKNQPDPFLSYGDYILLSPIKLLGLAQKIDLVALYYFYAFLGVFFLIILIYFFVLQLSGKKLLSIAAAVFVIGGYSIVYHKTLFYHDFNAYGRLIYPYLSSFFFFLYLNLLVKSLKSVKFGYGIFAALVFGLMFYLYFYLWSFTLALNASLLLIYIFKKDFLPAKKILLISAGGLILGAYNLWRLFGTLYSDFGRQMSYFNCMSYGHWPIFSKIVFLNLILFAIFWHKNRNDQNIYLILATILGGWISLNQQIITGRMLEYGHYYWFFVVPLSIIVSFYMVWRLIKNEKLNNYLFIILIVIAFINTIGGQYRSFYFVLEGNKYQENFGPIIDYLNQNQKQPTVILTDEDRATLFTIYTSNDLFWHLGATQGRVSIQRMEDAFFVYSYLDKNSRNNLSDYLFKIMADDSVSTYYKADYRDLEGFWSGYDYYTYGNKTHDPIMSQKRIGIIAQLQNEYNEALKDDGINKLLKKYEVGYAVWDKNKYPDWDLSGIEGLTQVFSFNNIYLYKLSD